MVASVMSFFRQYTVLYSQLARPYSFGLLFSLFTIWFWLNIIQKLKVKPDNTGTGSNNLRDYSLFTISAILATIHIIQHLIRY